MDANKCQAYTNQAIQCSNNHVENEQYCRLHKNKVADSGPHSFQTNQLRLKHKFEQKELDAQINRRQAAVALGSGETLLQISNDQTIAVAEMTVRHRNEFQTLMNRHQAEIAENGGRDPDDEARHRSSVRRLNHTVTIAIGMIAHGGGNHPLRHHYIQQLDRVLQQVNTMINAANQVNNLLVPDFEQIRNRITETLNQVNAERLQALEWGGEQFAVPVQHPGVIQRAIAVPNNLGRIANDSQNVHTQLVVEQTKKNIAEILKITVPEEFKWQKNKLSLTYKSIIMFCHLSPKAAWQFSSMYCSDATIYDLVPGIFGKVVDGVWQYISKSPDKKDLKKILSTELRDNIGMCAQGNLSRICNVLQGYLDGIGQKESVATILGREFPKLMEIENETERVHQGIEILRANNVPDDQWTHWLDPLRE